MFLIVEKKNENEIYARFDTKKQAKIHLKYVVPMECQKGFYTNRSLTKKDFKIIDTDKVDNYRHRFESWAQMTPPITNIERCTGSEPFHTDYIEPFVEMAWKAWKQCIKDCEL